jgi:hypothetical protein
MGKTVEVSSRNTVLIRIATSMLGVLVSGRLLTVDTNKIYLVLGLVYFLSSLLTSATWIVYAQWRSRNGWVSSVELPYGDD